VKDEKGDVDAKGKGNDGEYGSRHGKENLQNSNKLQDKMRIKTRRKIN